MKADIHSRQPKLMVHECVISSIRTATKMREYVSYGQTKPIGLMNLEEV